MEQWQQEKKKTEDLNRKQVYRTHVINRGHTLGLRDSRVREEEGGAIESEEGDGREVNKRIAN